LAQRFFANARRKAKRVRERTQVRDRTNELCNAAVAEKIKPETV
jgi:hypothetical protein